MSFATTTAILSHKITFTMRLQVHSSFLLTLFIFLLHTVAVKCVKLPDFIKPCNLSDPHLNTCITQVAKGALKEFCKGLPDLGIPSLDPARLQMIDIQVPGLEIVYNDTILTGLSDSRLENIRLNVKRQTLKLEFVGNLTMTGKYRINGRILILPIVGDGDYTNIIRDIRIKLKYKANIVKGDDGKDHLFVEMSKKSYTVGGAFFDLKNLFNGNRLLADTTLQFLNENWNFIMREIAPPAVDQIIGIIVKTVNKFYAEIPMMDLFTPM